jgi:hypothetical protein
MQAWVTGIIRARCEHVYGSVLSFDKCENLDSLMSMYSPLRQGGKSILSEEEILKPLGHRASKFPNRTPFSTVAVVKSVGMFDGLLSKVAPAAEVRVTQGVYID